MLSSRGCEDTKYRFLLLAWSPWLTNHDCKSIKTKQFSSLYEIFLYLQIYHQSLKSIWTSCSWLQGSSLSVEVTSGLESTRKIIKKSFFWKKKNLQIVLKIELVVGKNSSSTNSHLTFHNNQQQEDVFEMPLNIAVKNQPITVEKKAS